MTTAATRNGQPPIQVITAKVVTTLSAYMILLPKLSDKLESIPEGKGIEPHKSARIAENKPSKSLPNRLRRPNRYYSVIWHDLRYILLTSTRHRVVESDLSEEYGFQ
jgi:hypothetical protein